MPSGDEGIAGFDGSLRMARLCIQSLWPKRWLRAFAGAALATGLGSSALAADGNYFAPPDPSHLNREADDPEKAPDPREKQPVKIDPIKIDPPKVAEPPKVEPTAADALSVTTVL